MSRSEYDASVMMAWRAKGMQAAEYPSEAHAKGMQAATPTEPTREQLRDMQNALSQAETARWEAMAAHARMGMAVHEPKELMTADDRKLLRRIYAGLAVFWIVTISAGVYWIYRAH